MLINSVLFVKIGLNSIFNYSKKSRKKLKIKISFRIKNINQKKEK